MSKWKGALSFNISNYRGLRETQNILQKLAEIQPALVDYRLSRNTLYVHYLINAENRLSAEIQLRDIAGIILNKVKQKKFDVEQVAIEPWREIHAKPVSNVAPRIHSYKVALNDSETKLIEAKSFGLVSFSKDQRVYAFRGTDKEIIAIFQVHDVRKIIRADAEKNYVANSGASSKEEKGAVSGALHSVHSTASPAS